MSSSPPLPNEFRVLTIPNVTGEMGSSTGELANISTISAQPISFDSDDDITGAHITDTTQNQGANSQEDSQLDFANYERLTRPGFSNRIVGKDISFEYRTNISSNNKPASSDISSVEKEVVSRLNQTVKLECEVTVGTGSNRKSTDMFGSDLESVSSSSSSSSRPSSYLSSSSTVSITHTDKENEMRKPQNQPVESSLKTSTKTTDHLMTVTDHKNCTKCINENSQNDRPSITSVLSSTNEPKLDPGTTNTTMLCEVKAKRNSSTVLKFGKDKVELGKFLKYSRAQMRTFLRLQSGSRDHLILTALSEVHPEKIIEFCEILKLTKKELLSRIESAGEFCYAGLSRLRAEVLSKYLPPMRECCRYPSTLVELPKAVGRSYLNIPIHSLQDSSRTAELRSRKRFIPHLGSDLALPANMIRCPICAIRNGMSAPLLTNPRKKNS